MATVLSFGMSWCPSEWLRAEFADQVRDYIQYWQASNSEKIQAFERWAALCGYTVTDRDLELLTANQLD